MTYNMIKKIKNKKNNHAGYTVWHEIFADWQFYVFCGN